jgi:glycosyltransferase involved in cell wall biosynthesis
MFEGKTVAVVVPAYNEETQIDAVITTMPDYVDAIIVVDDASRDDTPGVVERRIAEQGSQGRVTLIRHEKNAGVGAAIVTGYKEAVRRGIDISAVMAGDGQMHPDQLVELIRVVARGEADYAKANRLFYHNAWNTVPKHRYIGNAFLSMLTKIASGYWHVADSQTGYTAITREALELIDLDGLYPRYGYPNDMLVRLNVYDMRVADVHMRPAYKVGERSKMKLWKVIPTMTWLIFCRFCYRMLHKYIINDFHPLVLFYGFSALTGVLSVALFLRMVIVWAQNGVIPQINALAWMFCFISSTQFALFAMWFDMTVNQPLRGSRRCR